MSMKYPEGACVVVLAKDKPGQLLVIERVIDGVTYYSLPGGKREPNESSTHNAVRELFEETGVRAQESQLVPLYNGFCAGVGQRTYWVSTQLVEFDTAPDIAPQEPGMVAYFVPISEFLAHNAFPSYNAELFMRLPMLGYAFDI